MIIAGTVIVLMHLLHPGGSDPQRVREAVLKVNLSAMRQVISSYHQEQGRYPETLDDLVTVGLLRGVPVDPMTDSSRTWEPVVFDPCVEASIIDVRSGALGTGLDGTSYRDW